MQHLQDALARVHAQRQLAVAAQLGCQTLVGGHHLHAGALSSRPGADPLLLQAIGGTKSKLGSRTAGSVLSTQAAPGSSHTCSAVVSGDSSSAYTCTRDEQVQEMRKRGAASGCERQTIGSGGGAHSGRQMHCAACAQRTAQCLLLFFHQAMSGTCQWM